jgi:hypothetical protein
MASERRRTVVALVIFGVEGRRCCGSRRGVWRRVELLL